MKIGDAGEAFFVFETDEDVPEELVTSPLLEATKPGESNAQVQPPPTGRFGAKEDPEHVEGTQPPLESSQEPDFLDLNAGTSDENSALSSTPPKASGISLSKPSSSQSSHEDNEQDDESMSLLGRTAQLGKAVIEAVQEVGKSEKDKLKDKNLKDVLVEAEREERHLFKDSMQAAANSSIPSIQPFGEDKGDEALPKVSPDAARPPEVVYTHGEYCPHYFLVEKLIMSMQTWYSTWKVTTPTPVIHRIGLSPVLQRFHSHLRVPIVAQIEPQVLHVESSSFTPHVANL